MRFAHPAAVSGDLEITADDRITGDAGTIAWAGINVDTVRVTFEGVPHPGVATGDALITAITVSPVPLPAALPLFFGALGGLIVWRRRRSVA